jgi:hypothetical protein
MVMVVVVLVTETSSVEEALESEALFPAATDGDAEVEEAGVPVDDASLMLTVADEVAAVFFPEPVAVAVALGGAVNPPGYKVGMAARTLSSLVEAEIHEARPSTNHLGGQGVAAACPARAAKRTKP